MGVCVCRVQTTLSLVGRMTCNIITLLSRSLLETFSSWPCTTVVKEPNTCRRNPAWPPHFVKASWMVSYVWSNDSVTHNGYSKYSHDGNTDEWQEYLDTFTNTVCQTFPSNVVLSSASDLLIDVAVMSHGHARVLLPNLCMSVLWPWTSNPPRDQDTPAPHPQHQSALLDPITSLPQWHQSLYISNPSLSISVCVYVRACLCVCVCVCACTLQCVCGGSCE